MVNSAVFAKNTRATPTKLLLFFSSAISMAAMVAAYGNFRCRHTRKFGSGNPGITSNDLSPFISRRHEKELNKYHCTFEHKECGSIFASTTACKSSTSDDATTSAYAPTTSLTTTDIQHMNQATRYARIGYGNTFPNPAVGCVLVRHPDGVSPDAIIGSGFHPKAGMPHAEVFALLEACGHVEDGVAAARSVMGGVADANSEDALADKVMDLFATYKSDDGASKLFHNHFDDVNVTAYVTLEPCCHWGKTPPCASSLAAAGIDRVVVGYRDPNPRVDGGGIAVLQDAGIGIHVLRQSSTNDDESVSGDEMEAATECSDLVKYFVKRISPKEFLAENLDDIINGKKRRALRSLAGRQKSTGTIQEIVWPADETVTEENRKIKKFSEEIPLGHRFLENIDEALWDHEIVLLRLNNVVQKKKGAKTVGGRIAEALGAHVAQVIGHTALLYRPAFPPVLDLDELVENDTLDDAGMDNCE